MSDTRELEARLRLQPEDAGGPSRMDMLRERIEAADALAAMRWIPVAERLPDERIRVLAWDGTIVEDCFYGWSGDYSHEDRFEYKWRYTDDETSASSAITHWMPLPAAPKE